MWSCLYKMCGRAMESWDYVGVVHGSSFTMWHLYHRGHVADVENVSYRASKPGQVPELPQTCHMFLSKSFNFWDPPVRREWCLSLPPPLFFPPTSLSTFFPHFLPQPIVKYVVFFKDLACVTYSLKSFLTYQVEVASPGLIHLHSCCLLDTLIMSPSTLFVFTLNITLSH